MVSRRLSPEVRAALGVGALAAAVRILWVLFASRPPQGLSDPKIYLAAARSIADGDGYTSVLGEPTAYYPPGYPFFLGGVRAALDLVGAAEHVAFVTGLLQALLGGVTAAAVVLIGSRLTGTVTGRDRDLRAGVVAGVVVALWPNLVLHSAVMLSETVFLAGFYVVLAAMCSWVARGPTDRTTSRRDQVLAALVVLGTAWCTLVRPQSVALLVPAAALAWWLGRVPWRRAAAGVGLVVAGIALAVVPWGLRNVVVMDAPVPMSTNTGDNLCIGFNDDADGTFMQTPHCFTEGRYVDGPEIEVARDGELRGRALRWIVDHPGELPRLSVLKLRATFLHDSDGVGAWESYGEDVHLSDGSRSALRWTSDLYYWAVSLVALVGLGAVALDTLRARRGDRRPPVHALLVVAVALSGALVPVMFFGEERFKVPIVPCIALLAAYLPARRWANRRPPVDVRDGASGPDGARDGARDGDRDGAVDADPGDPRDGMPEPRPPSRAGERTA